MLTYKIDTYEGQSGSPVYQYFDTGIKIIAIHTRGNKNMNLGNRITDDVFNNIKNGLNKYSNSIWILYCILVIIMMSSYIVNNEENVSKVVNPITFYVQNKEKQQIKRL